MPKEDSNFEKNIKIAFSRVKEDILSLKKELEAIKQGLKEQKHNSPQETKGSLRQHTVNIASIQDENLSFDELKKELEDKFIDLSDSEFFVFMGVYQLEEELDRPVSYGELANKLRLSPSSIRTYLSNLSKRKLPIIRKRHKKIGYVSIPKDFRNLKLAGRLVNMRSIDSKQKTLFD